MLNREDIPDSDILFHRIHIHILSQHGGKLAPNCFRDPTGQGLSCDWSKYSDADTCRKRTGKPHEYGVTSFSVGKVRKIQNLVVEHSPLAENVSHSDIKGLGTKALLTEQRHDLYEACDRTLILSPEVA